MNTNHKPARQYTSGRVLWVIWCLFWGLIWLGLALQGARGWFVLFVFAAASFGAIAIPVGKGPKRQPPEDASTSQQ